MRSAGQRKARSFSSRTGTGTEKSTSAGGSSNLSSRRKDQVEVANLSVGGMHSAWGLTMVDKVVDAKPDLVLLAVGTIECTHK
jgi:hypothetical protein